MRRSSLPNVKDNLIVTRSNARYPNAPSPNVSRSWSPREVRVRAEERLARSVGDRDQERRVLEWCKKNRVNVVRRLPKLDSAILTARGVNTDKFMTFVDEAQIVEKEPRPTPYDPNKEKSSSALALTSNFCKYCQREMPSKKRKKRPSFYSSPYECEYCGASNDIDSSVDGNLSSDSDDDTTVPETVHDTIRRGNPTRVIDHRSFPERTEKSEKGNLDETGPAENDEMDIFWRDDAHEYFHRVDGEGVEDKMKDLSLSEGQSEKTVFLTEAHAPSENNRPVQVKMAWDDENNNQFAEISRTIATDDGLDEKDVSKTLSNAPERYSGNSDMRGAVCLFQENDPTSGMKIRVHGRTPRAVSADDHVSDDVEGHVSDDVQGHAANHVSAPRKNLHYGNRHEGPPRMEGFEVTRTVRSSSVTISENEQSDNGNNTMTRSPVANRSVGLSRVALMRLSRESRSRTRPPRSSPGERHRNSTTQVGF